MNPKKVIAGVITAVLLIVGLSMIGKLWEDVDAGEVVVIQDPFDGELHVIKESGFTWQGGGRATHYRKSNQFWFNFSGPKVEEVGNAIGVKWNDGGHAYIGGSVRYDLPLDDKQIIKLHSTFGSQEGLESQLIKTNIEKAIYMTGPLMTSKESYAEKRNDLIFYIEDQASRGVYKTRQRDVKEVDQLTGAEKVVTRVEIVTDSTKQTAMRQEASPINQHGIKLYNISIKEMRYDANVEKQIATQQQAMMQVQTSIANAKRAEQDAITAAKQGEADAAKAKWEQEVLKATAVTKAEQELAVQDLNTKKAASYKQQQILEGEGEAAKKRLVMQANGALEQKIEAYVKVQQFMWDAFGKFQGSLVPAYQSGGATNNAINWMELMGMKAAKDLNLDMKNTSK
jgi:hypothetical protein